MKIEELLPFSIERKSFYKKAFIKTSTNNIATLESYGTPIATYDYNKDEFKIIFKEPLSKTTNIHLREFYFTCQNDCSEATKKEITALIKAHNKDMEMGL